METKIVVMHLNGDTSSFYGVDSYSDFEGFLTIIRKYSFPNASHTTKDRINLNNIIGYEVIISETKEKENNG